MFNHLWDQANDSVEQVVTDLLEIKAAYRTSNMDPARVVVRCHTIDTKIAALKLIKLDPEAYPWSTDDEPTDES